MTQDQARRLIVLICYVGGACPTDLSKPNEGDLDAWNALWPLAGYKTDPSMNGFLFENNVEADCSDDVWSEWMEKWHKHIGVDEEEDEQDQD